MGLTRQNSVYDGKKLWERYTSWGAAATHKKLNGWATDQGMVTLGKSRSSGMGPFYAMWRYAFHNIEECYPQYRDWWFETDPEHRVPTMEDFIKDVARHARNASVVSPTRFRRFCAKYNIDINSIENRSRKIE